MIFYSGSIPEKESINIIKSEILELYRSISDYNNETKANFAKEATIIIEKHGWREVGRYLWFYISCEKLDVQLTDLCDKKFREFSYDFFEFSSWFDFKYNVGDYVYNPTTCGVSLVCEHYYSFIYYDINSYCDILHLGQTNKYFPYEVGYGLRSVRTGSLLHSSLLSRSSVENRKFCKIPKEEADVINILS